MCYARFVLRSATPLANDSLVIRCDFVNVLSVLKICCHVIHSIFCTRIHEPDSIFSMGKICIVGGTATNSSLLHKYNS